MKRLGVFILGKRLDLIGQRFGKLTVVGDAGKDNKHSHSLWNCVCDCGESLVVMGKSLKGEATTSCGCNHSFYSRSKYKDKEFSIRHYLYRKTANKAVFRKLEFSLSFEDFIYLVLQPCFYCREVETNSYSHRCFNFSFKYNGLDRVDNRLGYTKSNVVPCCIKCNKAKLEMTTQEFQDWIKRVNKYYIENANTLYAPEYQI